MDRLSQTGRLVFKGNEISPPDLGSGPRTLVMGSDLRMMFWVDADLSLLFKNRDLQKEYLQAHPELSEFDLKDV